MIRLPSRINSSGSRILLGILLDSEVGVLTGLCSCNLYCIFYLLPLRRLISCTGGTSSSNILSSIRFCFSIILKMPCSLTLSSSGDSSANRCSSINALISPSPADPSSLASSLSSVNSSTSYRINSS